MRDKTTPPYLDASYTLEERIGDLLNQMTLEEKIGQLVQSMGAEFDHDEALFLQAVRQGRIGSRIMCNSQWAGSADTPPLDLEIMNRHQRVAVEESRLGIPLIYAQDVIHGHRTVAPIPLAQAASFDPDQVCESAGIAAAEASSEGIHWTFAPMMDICRDLRWGRVVECLGEDPYLAEVMAVAMVTGFQTHSEHPRENLLACAKHFAGYGFAEGGRDYDCSEITDVTLHNTILRPFKAAVQKAGCQTVMPSFQANGGIPMTASVQYLQHVLRDAWSFDGLIISDWGAIEQIYHHGASQDMKQAVEKAITAGVGMEMVNDVYPRFLPELIEEGRVSMDLIHHRVSEVLRIKFRAGLFEYPYTDPTRRTQVLRCREHVDRTCELAANSMVLARNQGVLPLCPKTTRRIAVVGPMAHERRAHLGTWVLNGRAEDSLSVSEAVRERFPSCEVVSPDSSLTDLHLKIAKDADVILCCVGESHENTGEKHSICRLSLPPGQEELIQALARFNRPFVVLCASGRPLPIPAAEAHAHALLYMWHGGTESTRAVAEVLAGDRDPGGRFPMTVPRHEGQIPIYYNRNVPGKLVEVGFTSHDCYQDEPFMPLYPFGFGLSYTEFQLLDVGSDQTTVSVGSDVIVYGTVRNTGLRSGSTVLQCYLRDPQCEISRPGKELVAFKKIRLEVGEELTVRLTIPAERLGYYLPSGEFRIDPGDVQWGLGFDSRTELNQKIRLLE